MKTSICYFTSQNEYGFHPLMGSFLKICFQIIQRYTTTRDEGGVGVQFIVSFMEKIEVCFFRKMG